MDLVEVPMRWEGMGLEGMAMDLVWLRIPSELSTKAEVVQETGDACEAAEADGQR